MLELGPRIKINMFAVSRSASSIEEGRRLENLSWRLWNRETFSCDAVFEANTTTPAISISATSSGGLYSVEPPSLSGSLDSLNNEEAPEVDLDKTPTSVSAPADTSDPQIQRQDSFFVVRGFRHCASLYPSTTLLTEPSPIPTADIAAANSTNGRMFAVGASLGEDLSSDQTDLIQPTTTRLKKQEARFSFGDSSGADGKTHKALADPARRPLKKQTSFKEDPITPEIVTEEQAFGDAVFETDEDEIHESAIDDDDSSEWEDSVDSGMAGMDEKTFQRVDPRPNLSSRRSLITTMLHQNDRENAFASAATASRSTPAHCCSRTSSPNGPSLAASPDSVDATSLMIEKGLKPTSENSQSTAQPIVRTTTNTTLHQLAISPRTTRRNMLSSELTVSLRQHLLWARKAVSNRSHTARNEANLKQARRWLCMDNKDDGDKSKWNDYYYYGQGLGYHSRGW